jgi:hypothetical protein
MLFIWLWDIWEQGHWRGEMRKELIEKIKRGQKNVNDKNNPEQPR